MSFSIFDFEAEEELLEDAIMAHIMENLEEYAPDEEAPKKKRRRQKHEG